MSSLSLAFYSTDTTNTDSNTPTNLCTYTNNTRSTGKTANHSYPTAGTYQVSLTVTDDRGTTTTITRIVTATAPTPASAQASTAPTGNQCLRTATPKLPVAGAWATIANVCANGSA